MLEDEPQVMELMMQLYYKHREFGGVALEYRLSPRRFAELRDWVAECMKLYPHKGISEDDGYLVMDIPVKIDERLPASALGIRAMP